MKTRLNKNASYANLEHRGGKKLSQQGVEFSHKMQEVRKHPPRGYRGKKD